MFREFRALYYIIIPDNVLFVHEESVKRIGHLPGTLLHKGGCGMGRDPRDLHTPRREFHHKQDVVRYQAMPRRHLHGEEVRGSQHFPAEFQKVCSAHASLAVLRGRLSVYQRFTPGSLA
jgi:hypothetical protein